MSAGEEVATVGENAEEEDALGISELNLRAGPSVERVLVRFYNITHRRVDVIWINYQGQGVKYGTLPGRNYLDLNTYEGHPWIFRDADTGEALVSHPGNSSVFHPIAPKANVVQRKGVVITLTVHPLVDLCVAVLAHNITSSTIRLDTLPLPIHLRVSYPAICHRICFRRRSKSVKPDNGLILLLGIDFSSQINQMEFNRDREEEESLVVKLMTGDSLKITQEAFKRKEYLALISALLVKSKNDAEFFVEQTMLDAFAVVFEEIGHQTAMDITRRLVENLNELDESANGNQIRNCILLISTQIRHVNLIRNGKLREFLIGNLPQLCQKRGDGYCGFLLLQSLLNVLLITIGYCPAGSEILILSAWKSAIATKEKKTWPLLLSFFFYDSIGENDNGKILERLFQEGTLEEFEHSSDFPVSEKLQIVRLFTRHFSTLVKRCSSAQQDVLFRYLWQLVLDDCPEIRSPIVNLFTSKAIFNYSSNLIRHWLRNAVLCLERVVDEQNSGLNHGIWLQKMADLIGDRPPQLEKRKSAGIWATIMEKFCRQPSLFGEKRVDVFGWQAVAPLFDIISLADVKFLPSSLREILLGVALILLSFFPKEQKPIGLAVRLLDADSRHLKSLMERWKVEGIVELLLKSVEEVATNRSDLIARFIVHWLTSSSSLATFDKRLMTIQTEKGTVVGAAMEAFEQLNKSDESDLEQKKAAGKVIDFVTKFFQKRTAAIDWKSSRRDFLYCQKFCVDLFKPLRLLVTFTGKYETRQFSQGELVREMQRVALGICTGLLSETSQVHDAVNFLLVMRAKGFLEKHLVDFRYLVPLVTVDANLVDQILKEAQPEEIDQFLERLDSSHLSDEHLRILELIARLKNERKREVLVNNVGVLTRQLLSDEFKEGQLKLIAALFPLIATDSDRSQSMVLLGLSILNRAYPIETIRRLEVVYDLLFSALRHCSFAVLHQPVAIYGCHLSALLTASQNLIPKMSLKEAEQWRHRLAKLCQLIAIHKPHFARITPMIIGECLENGRETEDALLVLLGMCDKYGMAMMSANLSIGYKHRLSTLYNQFKKVNQVVV